MIAMDELSESSDSAQWVEEDPDVESGDSTDDDNPMLNNEALKQWAYICGKKLWQTECKLQTMLGGLAMLQTYVGTGELKLSMVKLDHARSRIECCLEFCEDIGSEIDKACSWSFAGDCWRVEDVRGLSFHALENVQSMRSCLSAASDHLRPLRQCINQHTFQRDIEDLTGVTTQSAADTVAASVLASCHSCRYRVALLSADVGTMCYIWLRPGGRAFPERLVDIGDIPDTPEEREFGDPMTLQPVPYIC